MTHTQAKKSTFYEQSSQYYHITFVVLCFLTYFL